MHRYTMSTQMNKNWKVGNRGTRCVTRTEARWGKKVLTTSHFSIAGVVVTGSLCS